MNRPSAKEQKLVPVLFVRISEISGLSEPGLTNHHCTVLTLANHCENKVVTNIVSCKSYHAGYRTRNKYSSKLRLLKYPCKNNIIILMRNINLLQYYYNTCTVNVVISLRENFAKTLALSLDISHGGNFNDTYPNSFKMAYGFYFCVGVIFAKKTKWRKNMKNFPDVKILMSTV